MRKFLISLLLASAAASPAIAGSFDPSDRQQARDDRQQVREERQQAREDSRPERSAPAERPSFTARQDAPRQSVEGNARFQGNPEAFRAEQSAVRQQVQDQRGQRFDQRQQIVDEAVAPGARMIRPPRESFDQQRAQRIEDRELRQSNRGVPNMARDRNPPVVSNVPRPGTQPPLRNDSYRRGGDVQWNTNWRQDHRYDWRNYRHNHRSTFHLGLYYDPFGWGYQPFSIGWRLWPAYYSQNYWINDPYMYRLPYAPPGTVWVRYWNDALLVDLYTGQVVDVIPSFFW